MKKKMIIVVVIIVLLSVAATLFFGYQYTQASKDVFETNGYVLVGEKEQQEEKEIMFSQGTEYKRKPGDNIMFDDVQGNKMTVASSSFVHYDTDQMSALKQGVIINLGDVSDGKLANFYSIQPQSLIQKNNDKYTLDNRGVPLEFDDFLWKLNDSKYMLVADQAKLHFSNEDVRDIDGFLEISYVDEGVIKLQTKDNLWQTISSDCYISLKDGKNINLSDRNVLVDETVALSFSKMVINADDNIEITPAEKEKEKEAKEVKIPKFNVETEDGKEGTAGVEGGSGEEGVVGDNGENGEKGVIGVNGESGDEGDIGGDGTTGTSGTDGTAGTAGTSGSSGSSGPSGSSGASGGTGGTGGTGNESRVYPTFTIQNWSVSGTSIQCDITANDDDVMLSEDVHSVIQVIESGTGNVVYEESGDGTSSDKKGHNFNFEPLYKNFTTGDKLQPDTQYRLVVRATFSPDEESELITRDFISKSFYTDSVGVFMEQLYTTQNSVHINITKMPYSNAEEITVYLFDSLVKAENFDPNSPDITYVAIASESINTAVGMGVTKTINFITNGLDNNKPLRNNTQYVARFVTSSKTEESTLVKRLSPAVLKMTTLKKMATVGRPVVVQNRASYCFNMQPLNVSDPDKGIVNYRYDIYDADKYNAAIKNNKPINDAYVTFVETKTSNAVSLQIDGSVIIPGNAYVTVLTVTFFDNDKLVNIVTDSSDEFAMQGEAMPTVHFIMNNPGEITGTSKNHEKINGRLLIDNSKKILDVSTENKLTVDVEAPGDYYKQFTFDGSETDIFTVEPDRNNISIAFLDGMLDGLKSNTQYRFTVYGFVDLNDGNGVHQAIIGRCVVSTPETKPVKAVWQDHSAMDTAISVRLRLNNVNNDQENNASYEMSTAEKMVVTLYEGTGSNKKFKAQTVVLDTKQSKYESDIKDTYYDLEEANRGVLIDESFFKLSSGDLKGATTCTIEIEGLYDYTYNANQKYQNKIDIIESTTVVVRQNAPPDLPERERGVSVTNIKNSDAETYGGKKDKTIPNDTIVGYRLTPQYDNGAMLGRNMTFYAFENNKFMNFKEGDYNEEVYNKSDIYKKVNQKDPVTAGIELVKSEKQAFKGGGSGDAPQFVFFLGDPPTGESPTGIKGGVAYQYAGAYNTTSQTGMSRGMQFRFVYTAELSTSATDVINFYYPHEKTGYENYKQNMTMSGIVDLPYQDPVIYAYPWAADKEFISWKYYMNDPDTAITKRKFTSTGKDHAVWQLNDSHYTIDTSDTQKVPGTETTIEDYLNNNTVMESAIPIVDMKFSPAKDLTTVKEDDFSYVVMPITQGESSPIKDGMNQMSAEVNWYNSSIYGSASRSTVDKVASSKRVSAQSADGTITYSMPKTVPLFRVNYDSKNFADPPNMNNVSVSVDTTQLAQNIITVNVKSISSEIAKQVAGIQLEFREKNGNAVVTLYKNISNIIPNINDSFEASIVIRTSELASLVGKNVNVTPRLLFDGGNVGLHSVINKNSNSFYSTYALRKYYSDGTKGNFMAPNIAGDKLQDVQAADNFPMNASLFTSAGINYINSNAMFVAKQRETALEYSLGVRTQTNLYYTSSAAKEAVFISPVQLRPFSIRNVTGGDFTLNNITPTITVDTKTGIVATLVDITISNIKLEGATKENVGDNIYFEVYRIKDGTNPLDQPEKVVCEATKNEDDPIKGLWPMGIDQTTIVFGDLKNDSTYSIIPYCIMSDKTKLVQLIDGNKTGSTTASYEVYTGRNVEISNGVVEYIAANYNNKMVNIRYDLEQTLGFTMKYELWQLEVLDDTVIGDDPIYSMQDHSDYVYSKNNNSRQINLGEDTTYLKYGGRYRLKIKAYPKGMVDVPDTEPLGEKDFDFSVPIYTQPGYYLTALPVKNDREHSMKLNITVSDALRTLMPSEPDHGKGEYIVRVYKASDNNGEEATQIWPQQGDLDVLRDSTVPFVQQISGLEGDTSYEVRLYGISDFQGNGKDSEGNPIPMLKEVLGKGELDQLDGKPYFAYEAFIMSTLNSDGVRYGDMAITSSADKIALTFDQAVGIESVIDKVSYTVSYTSSNGNVVTKTDTVKVPIDVVDVNSGAYSITLPISMTEKVRHNVTIQLKDYDGKVLKTISGQVFYR